MKRLSRLFAVMLLVLAVSLLGLAGLASQAYADTTTPATPGQQLDQGTPSEPAVPGATEPQQQATQQVFFYKDGQLAGVERNVTGGAQVAGFTISELLKGPTEDEKSQGYSTQLPDGVKMLYYTESNDGGTFGVDLSSDLEAVQGDPVRARQALDQVVKTAQGVSGAATINITIGGEDAWYILGIAKKSSATGGSNLWWIILVVVLGSMTLGGTALMLLAMRRSKAETAEGSATTEKAPKAASKGSVKPLPHTARKGFKVNRAAPKKRRLRFPKKDGKK